MKKRNKYQNIIDDAFEFIKYRCGYCGKLMKSNKNFCSMKCKALYFEKMNNMKIGKYVPKKKQNKQHVEVSTNILSEEYLKTILEETERNISKRMSNLRR